MKSKTPQTDKFLKKHNESPSTKALLEFAKKMEKRKDLALAKSRHYSRLVELPRREKLIYESNIQRLELERKLQNDYIYKILESIKYDQKCINQELDLAMAPAIRPNPLGGDNSFITLLPFERIHTLGELLKIACAHSKSRKKS